MLSRKLFDFPMWGWKSRFDEMDRLKREMDRLFDGLPGAARRGFGSGVFPPVNVTEDQNNYLVRAELPGIAAEDLDIQATMNSLSITGERKIEPEKENIKYHRREREAGKFSRIINLPDAIDAEKIKARLVHGILTVTVPKSEAARPRQIKIS